MLAVAEIILNGLSADVVKTVENGQTWYRVFSGPYDSQDAALAAQQTLQHSGIDSNRNQALILLIKRGTICFSFISVACYAH